MSAEKNTTSFLDSLQVPDQAVLTDLLREFDDLFNLTFKRISKNPTYETYIDELSQGTSPLIESIKSVGAFSYKKIHSKENESLNSTDLLSYYLINFTWIESAKSLMTLWRNVIFESQKAWLLHLEHQTGQGKLETLRTASLQAIQNAYDDHAKLFLQEKDRIGQSAKAIEKQISKWALQEDPLPVYYRQLEQLDHQIPDLSKQQDLLINVSNDFLKIKTLIIESIQFGKNEFDAIKKNSQKAIKFIEEEQEKTGRIITYLDDLKSLLTSSTSFDFFDRNLKNLIEETTEKSLLVISAHQGMLQRKEIDFQKDIRQWLEYEILPLVFEIWELKDQMKNAMKLSFINIRNRIVVLSNEKKEGREINLNDHALEQPLVSFLTKASEWEKELVDLEEDINQKLNQSFGVFSIYQPIDDFLPIPIESTIKQFRVDQNKWFERGQKWFKNRLKAIQKLRTFVKQEEQLSVSEKVVRLIQSRKTSLNENQYAGIFLTKGYIGESFIVGRKAELLHIKKLIQQWNSGFRGAVILSGKRFSGRTLFGDLVANRYFPKSTLKLQPNTLITIGGRQFNTSCDLESALNFLKKYAVIGKTMVWIDDLELWNDHECSLSRNVRKLNQFIDAQSKQMFFMVSMTNWTKHHYNNVYEINKRFQAEINMDNMSKDDIREAILIRHGATHRVLVNKDGKEEGAPFYQKNIAKLYNTVEGNIGDALLQWSLSIHKNAEEKVIFRAPEPYYFPDLNDSDIAVVLSTLMMEKRTDEFRLSKLFGPAFKDKYASILKRLHSTGLLNRFTDGSLELNETIVNDVGRFLERKKFLNFYYKK